MYLVLHLGILTSFHVLLLSNWRLYNLVFLFARQAVSCVFWRKLWLKNALLNKNVNYAFDKCWSKYLFLQYGTLNGPKRVFQQKMVLFSSQTSYSRESMSTNITQVRDKFSWQVNLWFIVPKWHDIKLTWALSHLPQRTNFPAIRSLRSLYFFNISTVSRFAYPNLSATSYSW